MREQDEMLIRIDERVGMLCKTVTGLSDTINSLGCNENKARIDTVYQFYEENKELKKITIRTALVTVVSAIVAGTLSFFHLK